MAFVFNAEAVAQAEEVSQGGGFGTGVHQLYIVNAYIVPTPNGNNKLYLKVAKKADGKGFGLEGFCIDPAWASGAQNYDLPKWNELANIAGMKTGQTVTKTVKHFGKDIQAECFVELEGKALTLALQTKYDVYNNKETSEVALHSSFNIDGKSIKEIEKNLPAKKSIKLEEMLKDYRTKDNIAFNKNGGASAVDNTPDEEDEEEVEF